MKRLYHIFKSQSFVRLSKSPYSTHIPYLLAISKIAEIRHVLEYGSGPYSTLVFCNKNAFPFIESVVSYENDSLWFEKVKERTENISFLDLRLVVGSMHKSVSKLDVNKSDLVFIDDSLSSRLRKETLTSVLSYDPKLLVIHDFENFAYRSVLPREFTYRFKSLLPNVGIYSKTLNKELCAKIDNLVEKYQKEINNDDIEAWLRIFSQEIDNRK